MIRYVMSRANHIRLMRGQLAIGHLPGPSEHVARCGLALQPVRAISENAFEDAGATLCARCQATRPWRWKTEGA